MLVAAAVACTRPNPAATCPDGTCSDPAFPFCDVDGSLGGGTPNTCIAVTCTAGAFGECRGDTAVVCNAGGNNYDMVPCPLGCAAGAGCKTCAVNSDCASGVCKSDGSCAADSEIAFAQPSPLPNADCSRANPCALDVALQTTKAFVELASGDYQESSTLLVSGTRTVVGQGAASTVVRGVTMPLNIFQIDVGANVTFDGITIRDAMRMSMTSSTGGRGVFCPSMPAGQRSVKLVDATLTNNNLAGLDATSCDVSILRTTMTSNLIAVSIQGGTVLIDRLLASSSTSGGLLVTTADTLSVTNSFFVRSANTAGLGIGVTLIGPIGSAVFDFNTIVDNQFDGISCNSGANIAAQNDIIARNGTSGMKNIDDTDGTCTAFTTPGSIVSATVTGLNFVSPDTAPFDYHLMAGSIAIDAVPTATLDHDFDGDSRPRGSGWDVGADEF